ncbi:MAG: hypothetical protein QXH91_00870, partial [Candidatus Bathyarchaeia archaeon]
DLVKQDAEIIVENGVYKFKGKEIKEDVTPLGLEPFYWTLRYLEQVGSKKKVKLKAAITGPFTLASYVQTKTGMFPFNTALSDFELVKQLARILYKSCEAAAREASMISIDEPILGVIVGVKIPFGYSEEDIIETYNYLRRACGEKITGTHICGAISPKLANILLQTELDFLSHEFHNSPKNIGTYKREDLGKNGKFLSVGCLSSKNPKIESPNEILEIMEKFKEHKDLIFTPDCGFRPLVVAGSREKGYEIAIKKLRNMVDAANKLKTRI